MERVALGDDNHAAFGFQITSAAGDGPPPRYQVCTWVAGTLSALAPLPLSVTQTALGGGEPPRTVTLPLTVTGLTAGGQAYGYGTGNKEIFGGYYEGFTATGAALGFPFLPAPFQPSPYYDYIHSVVGPLASDGSFAGEGVFGDEHGTGLASYITSSQGSDVFDTEADQLAGSPTTRIHREETFSAGFINVHGWGVGSGCGPADPYSPGQRGPFLGYQLWNADLRGFVSLPAPGVGLNDDNDVLVGGTWNPATQLVEGALLFEQGDTDHRTYLLPNGASPGLLPANAQGHLRNIYPFMMSNRAHPTDVTTVQPVLHVLFAAEVQRDPSTWQAATFLLRKLSDGTWDLHEVVGAEQFELRSINASGVIAALSKADSTAVPPGHALLLMPVFDNYFVDRDDALRPWETRLPLGPGQPIYSGPDRTKPNGSTERGWTGDLLHWKANLPATIHATVATYQWEARRQPDVAGGEEEVVDNYRGGPEASEWKFDANRPLNWKPGKYKVRVTFTLIGGTAAGYADWEQEVGVRSKEMVVIGWIDPSKVLLNTEGVDSYILYCFPPDGQYSSRLQKLAAGKYLGEITVGLATPTNPGSAESVYILKWMFKYGANIPPPGAFATADELEKFISVKTNYKLLQKIQIKYFAHGDAFKSPPQLVGKRQALIGETKPPLVVPVFGKSVYPGRAGLNNDKLKVIGNLHHYINEGTPDTKAVAAFNNLMNPLKWNNIGCRAVQGVSFLAEHDSVVQVYPTYWIYSRYAGGGYYISDPLRIQNPEPAANFKPSDSTYANEHPTGSAPFLFPD